MPELSETTEVNKISEMSDETEGMDADFEAELDGKCEECSSRERSIEDIQIDKEGLMQMCEELMKYKEARKTDFSETDNENDAPEKAFTLRRQR